MELLPSITLLAALFGGTLHAVVAVPLPDTCGTVEVGAPETGGDTTRIEITLVPIANLGGGECLVVDWTWSQVLHIPHQPGVQAVEAILRLRGLEAPIGSARAALTP